jgi:hypothetical protein
LSKSMSNYDGVLGSGEGTWPEKAHGLKMGGSKAIGCNVATRRGLGGAGRSLESFGVGPAMPNRPSQRHAPSLVGGDELCHAVIPDWWVVVRVGTGNPGGACMCLSWSLGALTDVDAGAHHPWANADVVANWPLWTVWSPLAPYLSAGSKPGHGFDAVDLH